MKAAAVVVALAALVVALPATGSAVTPARGSTTGSAVTPASGSTTGSAVTPARAAKLGAQAYRYGFPLLEFLRVRRTETSVRCPDKRGDAPVNAFGNATGFARPSDRSVVAPNVDTLYSIAHLDLGHGPVVLSHPAMGRRYFVFELVDPYTNVIGYIGTRTTGSAAGRFAITWTGQPGRRVRGARVIRSAYRRVWVIGRTLAGDRADQRRALALMRQYQLTPPAGPRRFPRRCRPGQPVKAVTPTGLRFLDELGVALAQNPPPARDRPLLATLASVGIGPGRRPERAGLSDDVLRDLLAGVDQTAASLPTDARLMVLEAARHNHGWAIPSAQTGNYGTNYVYRAEIASVGLGANTPREAMYPVALTDAAGQLLNGSSSYRIVFRRGQLPPERAFWSLTMYDSSGYLVANPAHRYAIGSSHPPLRRSAGGSIVVIVSRRRPTGPGVNWLPAPAGGFRLTLRIYRPKATALDGRWQPPPVEPITTG
jgi:hypothetical protein